MVRLTDRPDMTLDVYRGRKTTMQQNATLSLSLSLSLSIKTYIATKGNSQDTEESGKEGKRKGKQHSNEIREASLTC